jgi:8-amino-7-oxononanoate synthase
MVLPGEDSFVNRPRGPSDRWRLQSGQGIRVRMGGRVLVNFSSSDYLDLATDPRVSRAAARAAYQYGCGAGASPVFSGNLPPHRALERTLAAGESSVRVFDSTAAVCHTLLETLAGPGDSLFSDVSNNPGLRDACNLSGASVNRYRHGDLDRLEHLFRREGAAPRRRVIVTDALFSLSGDSAPLTEILGLAERFDTLVVLDESHALGVLGSRGRGLADLLPEQTPGQDRLIRLGSLGHAFAGQGAFVHGPRKLLRQLAVHPRLSVASCALAVPVAAAVRRAVQLAAEEPDRRQRALALGDRLRSSLLARGFSPGASRHQIVTVRVGDARVAVTLSRRLEVMGLLVPAICPPLVPPGTSRLRISLTAGHTDIEVDRFVDSLCEIWSALTV